MEDSENKQENGFEIPFHVDDILKDNNKHKIHKKPLLNAESMVKKGKYKSALEIYIRTVSKFPEPEIREKIDRIIQELESFIQKEDKTYSRKTKHHTPIQQNFTEEKDFSSALKELSDDLTRSLKEGLEQLESIHSELPKELEMPSDSNIQEETQRRPQEPENIQPIIITTDSSKLSSSNLKMDYSNESATQEISKKTLENLQKLTDSLNKLSISQSPLLDLKADKQKFDVTISENEKTSPENLNLSDIEFQNLINKLNLGLTGGLPAAEWVPKETLKESQNKPEITGTRSAIDVLAELYHTEDWKPFRHLPLVDRRSGKDRRTKNIPVAKERRSGIERRKVDLFKQRENFLREWSAQIQSQFPSLGIGTSSESHPSLEASSSYYKPSDFGILEMPENLKEGNFIPNYIPIGLPSSIHSRLQDQPSVDQNSVKQESPAPRALEPIQNLPGSVPANREYVREISSAPYTTDLVKIGLPEPLTLHLEGFADAPKRNISWELPVEGALKKVLEREPREITEKEFEELKGLTTQKVLFPTLKDETIHELFKIELPEPIDTKVGKTNDIFGTPGAMPKVFEDTPPPDVEIVESDTPPPEKELEIPAIEAPEKEPEPERMIHGILELKPPEVDDAPFLTLTYDFSKIPHSFRLSKNYSLMEYSYYKYKPMLMKAQEFARRKMLKNALNYYRVIKAQNIPAELKKMINRNIMDITEFLEKYLMSKGN